MSHRTLKDLSSEEEYTIQRRLLGRMNSLVKNFAAANQIAEESVLILFRSNIRFVGENKDKRAG